MIRILILFILVLCGTHLAQAQYYNQQNNFIKANSVWAFGNHAGIDFNPSTPVPIQTAINNLEGSVSVADPVTGALLFYSDGATCWNANHQPMPNGSGLIGNSGSATEGICAVPVIDSPGKYYLFSLNGYSNVSVLPEGSLFYSVVDMSLNSGLGDIDSNRKNIALDTDSLLSEGMVAIPGDNCDIWLMVHAYKEPVFKAYHITTAGINPDPVISDAGGQLNMAVPESFASYAMGGMTVSSDRQLIGLSSWVPLCMTGDIDSLTGFLLCRFDPATGTVGEAIEIGEKTSVYNAAFSPDNTLLYMVRFNYPYFFTQFAQKYELMQYNVSEFDATAIEASATMIDTMMEVDENGAYLRLYRDTIYMVLRGNLSSLSQIGVIYQPNEPGIACDFQVDPFGPFLPETNAIYTFPKEVVYPLDNVPQYQVILDTLICSGWSEGIALIPASGGEDYSYIWSDGSQGSSLNVTASGTYWVSYNDSCHYRTDTFVLAGVELTPVITVDLFTLGTTQPYSSYQWLLNGAVIAGATNSTYTVSQNGDYQVIVTGDHDCIDTSAVYPVTNVGIGALDPLGEQISVYPNPIDNMIYIHAPFPVDLRITDATGRHIMEAKAATSASLGSLAKGMYFLYITGSDQRPLRMEKLVKY